MKIGGKEAHDTGDPLVPFEGRKVKRLAGQQKFWRRPDIVFYRDIDVQLTIIMIIIIKR